MDYQQKYIKYKNKYEYLKNFKYLNENINFLTNDFVGGADTDCEIVLDDPTSTLCIIISYSYSDQGPNHKIIKNFKIVLHNKTNNTKEEAKLTFELFFVNNDFFENEINIEHNMVKKTELFKKKTTKYDFIKCENLNIPNNYFKINNDSDVKTFIVSYFKKNMCIINQSTKIFTSTLQHYHNLLELYITLCIIHQYNKIELVKFNSQNQGNRYNEIYKHIPKYIESDIDNNKIEFLVDNNKFIDVTQNINGINGNNLKIIFDSGNASITLISSNFLKYLCYLDIAGNVNLSLKNKLYLEKFYKPGVCGIGGSTADAVTNLYLLKFKFIDQKLNNEKVYSIYAFECNNPTYDLLLGQNTMSQLYDDGYSIKWHLTISKGKRIIDDTLINYNRIINNDHTFFINRIPNHIIFQSLLINEHQIIIKIINNFKIGLYFERLSITDIRNIKTKLKSIYVYIKQIEHINNTSPTLSSNQIISLYNQEIPINLLDRIFQ